MSAAAFHMALNWVMTLVAYWLRRDARIGLLGLLLGAALASLVVWQADLRQDDLTTVTVVPMTVFYLWSRLFDALSPSRSHTAQPNILGAWQRPVAIIGAMFVIVLVTAALSAPVFAWLGAPWASVSALWVALWAFGALVALVIGSVMGVAAAHGGRLFICQILLGVFNDYLEEQFERCRHLLTRNRPSAACHI